jgi:hypothetical protein
MAKEKSFGNGGKSMSCATTTLAATAINTPIIVFFNSPSSASQLNR